MTLRLTSDPNDPPRHRKAGAEVPSLLTPGRVAERLGVPLHRVQYVLRSRGRTIRPVARAGRLRLYNLGAVERVRRELASIEARREGVARAD